MSRFSKLYRGDTRINFIGSRKRWYAASGLLVAICLLSFIVRGFHYGVEFSGGTTFQINASGTNLTTAQVEKAFSDAGKAPENPPQDVGSGSTRQITVSTSTLTPGEENKLQAQVAKTLKIDARKSISSTSIGSQWGHDTTITALQGLIVFLIAVSIYIGLRFQWRMAVGGMIALLNDLIIAAGIYSIIGFEVTPSTIVGLLTILGFSLYDTVVVYDKVAENTRDILAGSRTTYAEAANVAVNQTLMRSINTSLIALLPVAGLLFVGAGLLGVGTIKDLALILFVGLASGAYSSLFLATPIVVDLTERDPQYQALARRVAAKRSSDAKRSEAEPVGAGVGATARTVRPADRRGGPAPAPRPGARPGTRPNRRRK